jgi:hypothetical protein
MSMPRISSDIKFTPRPDEEAPKGPRRIFISLAALVLVAILIIVLAIPTIQQAEENDRADIRKEVELSDNVLKILQEVEVFAYSNATELVSKGEDIQKIQEDLNQNVDEFLDLYKFDPYPHFIQNSQISIKRIGQLRLTVEEGFAPVLVPNFYVNPENIGTGEYRTIDCRVPLVRKQVAAPVFLKLSGNIHAQVKDSKGILQTQHNHSINRRLPFPLPFIERSQDLFAMEGQGRESMMSRMVNYMLTTVCRYRMMKHVEYGMGANESPRNVLNEGDVELAVNIAILLWQMKVFGNFDQASVDAVDEYFFNASLIASRSRADVYNPTGRRPWGEGETQNYIERYYPARQPINYLGRTLNSLVMDFCFKGMIDPADIITLYLCLDQQPNPFSMLVDPTDMYSILYEKSLFNARYQDDFFDVVNQEVYLNLSEEEQMEFRTLGPNRKEDYSERLNVDQSPDYLIAGRDIHIEGIYPPKAWYTNVVMTVEEYLWKPQYGPRTRCQEWPPGQRPPDHDFRFFWDMDVNLKFNLKVSENRRSYHDAYLTSGCTVDRYVEMDFPVQIFIFWDTEIPKNDALKMHNLNEKDEMSVYENGTSYWFITSESDALEYVSKHMWQNLRPYNSLNMDELVAIEGAFRATDKDDASSVSEFTKVLTDTLFWKGQKSAELFTSYVTNTDPDFMRTPYYNMYRFIKYYLLYWEITTDDLKPLILDGLNVTTDFNEITDTLKIFIRHTSATFILTVSNVRSNSTRDITLRTTLDIDGLQLDVEYHPLSSSFPTIHSARLFDAFDLAPRYRETELTTAAGLDPVVAVTECYGISLGGLDLEVGQSSMDSRFIIPVGGLATQTLQGGVDTHLVEGSDSVQLSALLDSIFAEVSSDIDADGFTGNYFPLGFENINHGYTLRLLLNTSGMSQVQGKAAQKDLLEWTVEYGPRIFHMLGNQVGSLEAYRALLEEDLSQHIRQNIIFVLAKPYEEDRLYSLNFQSGMKEFKVIPDGFYRQDCTLGPMLFYGIGVEEEHLSPTDQVNILKGQFIKGGATISSGLSAA